MLHEHARHEPLLAIAWDADAAQAAVERIVRDTEERFSPGGYWPVHPLDAEGLQAGTLYPLYFGACGVIWALHYLNAAGGAALSRSYVECADDLASRIAEWLRPHAGASASYLMGETSALLLEYFVEPRAQTADRVEELIAANIDSPTRELMWGAPGTLLAASFLYDHTGQARWAELYGTTARKLWSQLRWSAEHECAYWQQDLYGRQSTYIDAVHGFVGNALPIVRGCLSRSAGDGKSSAPLLPADECRAWIDCIVNTVQRTATHEGTHVNWRPQLYVAEGTSPRMYMQICHGAPGFVVCLADLRDERLDDLLLGAGEAIWAAGPVAKGSTLCHGTAGNGYAFLKLYERTGKRVWLERARAFAMHSIAQTEAAAARYGAMRYSLWTGDLGVAVYLWDCIRGAAAFPTVDAFFAGGSAPS